MLKNLSRLESVIGDKTAHLYLDMDTPLNVVKDMLFEFIAYVGNIEAQMKQQQAMQAAQVPSALPGEAVMDGAQMEAAVSSETASQPILEQPVEPQAQ